MEYIAFGIFLIASILVYIAALCDLKRKEIPNAISALLWVCSVMYGLYYEPSLLVISATFALLYMVNTLLAIVSKPLLSWGDILLIPPVAGLMSINPIAIILLGVLVLWGLIRAKRMNREEPLAPYVGLAFFYFYMVTFLSN